MTKIPLSQIIKFFIKYVKKYLKYKNPNFLVFLKNLISSNFVFKKQ